MSGCSPVFGCGPEVCGWHPACEKLGKEDGVGDVYRRITEILRNQLCETGQMTPYMSPSTTRYCAD